MIDWTDLDCYAYRDGARPEDEPEFVEAYYALDLELEADVLGDVTPDSK